MNIKQIIILTSAVALFIASELFPPWFYEDAWTSAKTSAGYHFLNNPPAVKSPREMKEIFSIPEGEPPPAVSVGKDRGRLSGQRIILLFLMPGLLLVFDERKTFSMKLVGIALLCIGLAFTAVYVWDVSAAISY
jgi:hypothetical protein